MTVAEQIKEEVSKVVIEYMTSEGFTEKEAEFYTRINVEDTKENYIVSVGAEVSYDGLMELSERLDKVITKYDKDAYFDAEDAGLLSAYVSK